jgi:hypothetical protein
LANEFLVIGDYRSTEKQIHLFDKNDFKYIVSIADKGQGPGEITNMGHIESDERNRVFFVSDHGKQQIFSYALDSIIASPQYRHKEKMKMNSTLFPDQYQYINDTISIGLVIAPIGNAEFKPTVAKWNMSTGEIKLMPYEHPKIEKKRISFAMSVENKIYAECYSNYDLITICNLEGELICNIYGSSWGSFNKNRLHYYGKVVFCGDKIFVAFSGGLYSSNDEYYPTKFVVFDIHGNYIKTLETEYKIVDFCHDKNNNRILLILDSEIQFAYIDITNII